MSQTPPSPDVVPSSRHQWWRWAIVLGLLFLAGVADEYLHAHGGVQRRLRDLAQQWVGSHAWAAPLILLGIYALLSLLMLPVWWVALLAGYCLGIKPAIAWCELGVTLGTMLSVAASRRLVGNFFRQRYRARIQRLQQVDDALGNNGMLVVLAVRLCHIIPFGMSNYLFGLTRIKVVDAGLGTLAGHLPNIAFWAALGARPGYLRDRRFWLVLVCVNILLLAPVGLRWLWGRRTTDGH